MQLHFAFYDQKPPKISKYTQHMQIIKLRAHLFHFVSLETLAKLCRKFLMSEMAHVTVSRVDKPSRCVANEKTTVTERRL